MTAALARDRSVTGVDISTTQLEMARRNVPSATFIKADMTTLTFDPASFDAVAAFYSLTHVPRDEQAGLIERIRGWLRPGGLFIASMGADDEPGDVESNWLGVDMYFSHFGAKANRRLVERAGLVIARTELAVEPEDRHDARFLWVVARAPSVG
jgi:ubiquinone/menaquinone biosynthesis C-methylase UbiE